MTQLESQPRQRSVGTAMIECLNALEGLKDARTRRLLVRALMEFYEVYGDHEGDQDE